MIDISKKIIKKVFIFRSSWYCKKKFDRKNANEIAKTNDILYSVFDKKKGIKEIISKVNITADFFLYSITLLLLDEIVVKIAGIEYNNKLAIYTTCIGSFKKLKSKCNH
jgi:hypothetical protein